MYEPMVKGICGAHRVHTNPSKEEEKKRCVAVKCFEGSGRYRRWFERISTLVVCKTPYRSEYNKVDSPRFSALGKAHSSGLKMEK